MEVLPVEAVLPAILASIREGRDVVLQAPPGSGKTTRVPPALMDADLQGGGGVLVLEPRRIAARLAARWVSEERGDPVGGAVGYQVRFERKDSARTRLLYLTEGLLSGRVLRDPELRGTSVVVFDEFHERSLHADLALGLVREVQSAFRPDLRVVVMSATLDAGAIAETIGAHVITAEGRRFPVDIEHAEHRAPQGTGVRMGEQVARAIAREVDRGGGLLAADTLVFLPGMGEIHAAASDLRTIAQHAGFDVYPLHGELSPEDQDRAVRRGRRPRVVLATNVAETSITLDGVSLVIDAGQERALRHDPRTGMEHLTLQRITKASAIQRAGRAGRQGPGRCIRLFTAGEFKEFPDSLAPEVGRVDLSAAVLSLKAWGLRDASTFAWVTAPSTTALEAAETLLRALGAADKDGAITPLGRRLVTLPMHPRLGRALLEGERRGCGPEVALLCAITSGYRGGERGRPRSASSEGRSDLLVLADRFHEVRSSQFHVGTADRLGFPARTARWVDRERRQIEGLLQRRKATTPHGRGESLEDDVLASVAAGFADRIGRRRGPGRPEILLVGGTAACLAENSVVRAPEFVAAVSLLSAGRSGRAEIGVASEVRPEWLEELFPGEVVEDVLTVWNAEKERAEGRRIVAWRGLELRDMGRTEPDLARAAELVAKAALHPRTIERLRRDGLAALEVRVATWLELSGGAPRDLQVELEGALLEACAGIRGLDELRPDVVGASLVQRVFPDDPSGLARRLPTHLRLPSGRNAPIEYRAGQSPLVAGKLQEFFGVRESPRVADGRLAVAIDLLAPNRRSIQITSDLEGFWKNLYPKERRELSRRYPRHPWPEDPWSATPTLHPSPRRRQ